MTRAQTVLDRLVALAEVDGFRAHAIHVRAGDDDARHLWDDDERRDIHSVAKGVCVLAAGIAADEGVFDLDAPVSSFLPGAELGAGVSELTTRHLLGMIGGVDFPWSQTMMTDWPDVALEFLRRPSRGRVFQYSNASTYTAMRALGAAVGDVRDWLGPRFFAPLGIDDPVWDRCPQGWILAGEGLHLSVGELAHIGRLIRDDGVFEGRRIVSPRWTRALHEDWKACGDDPPYDRYALAGWAGPGAAWRLHGAHGQLLIFLGDAVVTVTADDHFGADRFAARVVATLAP